MIFFCIAIICSTLHPRNISIGDYPLVDAIDLPRYDDKPVRIRGIVRDVISDERDPSYVFMLVQTPRGVAYAACDQDSSSTNLTELLGAEILVSGVCRPANVINQPRKYLGHFVGILRKPFGITVLSDATSGSFDVPWIDPKDKIGPSRIAPLTRRRLLGHVIATWGDRNILVQTKALEYSHLELANGPLPSVGDFIEASGFLETDTYRQNLTRSVWKKAAPWQTSKNETVASSASEILTDKTGHLHVNTAMYGKTIELTGSVLSLPDDTQDCVIQIDNNGYQVPVDISSCPSLRETLSIGCRIKAIGICVLNIDNCRLNDILPQVKGFTLIARASNDIVILSRPPWWTASRLTLALCIVFGCLIVILVWNRSLSVLAERRGRQLAEEQVGRATSELKVLERTRFSAELHDALSQTLSGIAMQLGAIKRLARTDPSQMLQHLDIASRTLKSCRDEMRNLLWDLRSQVLDEPDLEKALRQILEPHLDETEVHIRFTVPRTRLTDSTARALFCIVRELTVNAIRHGHASIVRIAGSLENGRLLCSVRDNGCGFDPSTAPGAEEGHFGLQGIRERMDALDGTVVIESTRDKGTKVTISLAAPHEEEKT